MPTIDTWTEMETFNFYQLAQVKHLETSFFNSFDLFESCTRPFDDELEDTGERLLAIRRSQEWLVCSRVMEHDDIAGKDQGSNFGQCCSLFGRVKKRTTTSRVERLLNRPARLEFADASRRK